MESPVSAFAIYKSHKANNKQKKESKKARKNKNKYPTPSRPLTEELRAETVMNIGKKLKQQNKKIKDSKNLIKKKSHKKKKNKLSEKFKNHKIKSDVSANLSDNEDIPVLIPGPSKPIASALDNTDNCSHSSDGIEFIPVQTDSSEEGLKLFKWMIAPYNPEEFLNKIWEKKPLHISRKNSNYYKDLITTPMIDNMLRNESIQFTKNIDITSYIDGKRETHNPEGRAHPHLVWDFYLNGCSIRLLNPQTYIPQLHLLNATLQEFFNSFVGANAYLTPPDSQGFAPHYDDIEAFILQTEGKKHWRIYRPREENEVLPRVSSKNFSDEEIGEPILEITLEAGDMLYFPRGYIHQGITINGEHSLHVTISMYQKHSWADLFEKMIPAALQMAVTENIDLRSGLPFDLYDNFGLVHSDANTPRKAEIMQIILTKFDKIKQYLPINEAVDQMGKNYQRDALPPVLSDVEKAVTVFGDTDVMIDGGKVINRVEMSLDTKIRLLRKNILRMVSEDCIRLYYYAENSLEYHGNELTFLEIDDDMAPAIENLIISYPEYVSIENLDLPNDTDKLQIADALWNRGLIMTEYPLENIDEE
ncbi:bifunctional lysine-specific demethylase and histidyl-hydroxylase NO66 [Leptidea sinapis]|uniref:bifunctional lysine-specific demethylase and histidyl-hydroxylase NO66 n=1 Tax=Leptidea sinapis TaxID=189913 RepID=UPI0021C2668A|nr:bifunctional lysine-specific demethylase and histidyl-hydroxylase NO66 [Leptidea sinapis]